MNKLAIWLPTYKRPDILAKVAKNIEETTHNPFTLYFGVEKDDKESFEAAKKTGHRVIVNKYEPGYSNTIQSLYEASREPYWFFANDDFIFLPDWDMRPIEQLDNEPRVMVIGCHDGNPQTSYKTICMARRRYIEEQSGVVDMPNRVFYPYNHNYIDTEFSETAQSRQVWDLCPAPCIEHHHYSLGHLFGEEVVKDATYEKNDATVGDDANTYNSRRHLW